MGLMSFHSPETLRRANPQLSDRELLGLPASFTPNRTLNLSADSFGALVAGGVAHWVDSLESQDCALAYRYTAGQILASVGDPRLNPLAPNMVLVPEATAQIGLACERLPAVMQSLADLNLDPDWIAKETPRHAVNLPAYKIGRYPVTNLEYKAFLLDSQAPRIPTDWFLGRYPLERANHPVSGISVEDAQCYIEWLSAKTGRAFHLPSEAQWEYAAAGPQGLQYPWGEDFLPDHANTAELGVFTTTPVGLFANGASPFGCLDMAGNVEEFVADDYHAYPGGAAIEDDLVTAVGTHRVARGGSYSRFRDLARTTRRHGKFPRDIYVMGFRLAESV